jgi:2-polyprenyl-6-methoxyphenol hydroxylase-like FAD-dependent oxidoreductase
MAASIALARAGVTCEIVEINSDWRPAGIGIGLQSPPLRALRAVDLFDPLVAAGRHHQFLDIVTADGAPIARMPQVNVNGPDDPPFVTMARITMHEVLEARLRELGVGVRVGTSVARLSDHGDRVEVQLTDGTSDSWDLVVGADGLHSRVRQTILPDAPAPGFAGQVIWRIAAARPAALDHYTIMIGGPTRIGLVPISEEAVYVWLLDSTLTAQRPAQDRLAAMFRERLDAYGFVVPEIAAQIDDATQIDFRALYWLLVPRPWHAGRVLLLGDAAHTTTPHLAFGVGLAFEDAVVLGELVAAGLAGDELGERFAARRFERCRLVVENSLALSRFEQDPAVPPSEHGRLTSETLATLAQPI